MFSVDLLRGLFLHMEWADARVWERMPDTSPPDDRLRNLLVHIHVVQQAFLRVWTDRPVFEVFRKPEDFAALAEVRAWAQPYYKEAHAFVEQLTTERLVQPIVMPWASEIAQHLGRPPGTTSLADTCFQVTSHSTYHRGQVNIRLRELGGEPPLVDYIAWVWFDRPAAVWKT